MNNQCISDLNKTNEHLRKSEPEDSLAQELEISIDGRDLRYKYSGQLYKVLLWLAVPVLIGCLLGLLASRIL
jgi:hypothetical protein